jgi:Transglycosylase SLT domain
MRLAFLCAALCLGIPIGALAQAQGDVFATGVLTETHENAVAADEAAFAYDANHTDIHVAPPSTAKNILAAAPITSPLAGFKPWKRELSKTDLCDAATIVAEQYRLPIQFFTNLIYQESSFETHVVSWAGAQGIAQFMPGTAAENGLVDPFDPIPALKASGRFLADLLTQFGNLGLAAAAYNGGPRRVQDWLDKRGGLPAETRDYVERVTGLTPESWIPSAAPKLAEVRFPTRVVCTTTSMIAKAEIGAMINSVVLAPRRVGGGGGGKARPRWKPGSMMAKWCGVNPGTCNRKPARLAAVH